MKDTSTIVSRLLSGLGFCPNHFKIGIFLVLFALSDGLKITAPVFDSLKFSKQATKRSLRENIRESVEKTGAVISVFLLSWPANGFTTLSNSIGEKLLRGSDQSFAIEKIYTRAWADEGVLVIPDDAILLERTLSSLSLFVNWSNAANEQLVGLQVNSSNNLRVGSQELIQLINAFKQALRELKNYWEATTDFGNLDGLQGRITILQEQAGVLASKTGFLKSNRLLEFHDYAIDHHQAISKQLNNAQVMANYHRQQAQAYRSRATTANERTKGTYLFLALQEDQDADYQESLSNFLRPKVDNGKKLLDLLALMQAVMPDFQSLLSATGSKFISARDDASYIQTNSSTTNTAYRDLRTNRLKRTMAELFEWIG